MTEHSSETSTLDNTIEWMPNIPPEVTEWDIIRAGMLFSNDKQLFDSHIIATSISRQMKKYDTWKMERYWNDLVAIKVDDERLVKRARDELRKGYLAGWMFAYLYIMACDKHIDEPSKSKAAYLVSESVKGKLWANSDKGIPTTSTLISKAFSEKSRVLHFWGALVFTDGDGSDFEIGKASDNASLEEFYRKSKGLQDFGVAYRSNRNKGDSPPVCNDSMWLLNDSVESFEILLGDTRDEVYNYLRNYRAD